MPVRDLLWACPACRSFGSIHEAPRRTERCAACGATFRRGKGASIEIRRTDGSLETATPAQLEDRLPPVRDMPTSDGRIGPAPALVRLATSTRPIHDGPEFLGRVELFGAPGRATVTLDRATLAIGLPEKPLVWPLERITAVQPSSSTLQINSRIHPLASIRFLEHSVRLWEEALHERIRRVHAVAGRGPILEFHPRIRFQ